MESFLSRSASDSGFQGENDEVTWESAFSPWNPESEAEREKKYTTLSFQGGMGQLSFFFSQGNSKGSKEKGEKGGSRKGA